METPLPHDTPRLSPPPALVAWGPGRAPRSAVWQLSADRGAGGPPGWAAPRASAAAKARRLAAVRLLTFPPLRACAGQGSPKVRQHAALVQALYGQAAARQSCTVWAAQLCDERTVVLLVWRSARQVQGDASPNNNANHISCFRSIDVIGCSLGRVSHASIDRMVDTKGPESRAALRQEGVSCQPLGGAAVDFHLDWAVKSCCGSAPRGVSASIPEMARAVSVLQMSHSGHAMLHCPSTPM